MLLVVELIVEDIVVCTKKLKMFLNILNKNTVKIIKLTNITNKIVINIIFILINCFII